MPLHIIAVGKKHESWVAEGIQRYQKRLKAPYMLEWVFLPHSSLEGHSARQEESDRVLLRLDAYDYVVLLDERGQAYDSPSLARVVTEPLSRSLEVASVIGGAYGVTDQVRQRVQKGWA